MKYLPFFITVLIFSFAAASMQAELSFEIDSSKIKSIVCTSNQSSIAAYSKNTGRVHIWSDLNRENKKVYQASARISSACWSPDGNYIALGFITGIIEIIELETLTVLERVIENYDRQPVSVVWPKDNNIISYYNKVDYNFSLAGFDKKIKNGVISIWDISNKSRVKTMDLQYNASLMKASACGRYLAIGENDFESRVRPQDQTFSKIEVFDLDAVISCEAENPKTMFTITLISQVKDIAWAPGCNNFAYLLDDGHISIFDLCGNQIASFLNCDSPFNTSIIWADCDHLIADGNGCLNLWDLRGDLTEPIKISIKPNSAHETDLFMVKALIKIPETNLIASIIKCTHQNELSAECIRLFSYQ